MEKSCQSKTNFIPFSMDSRSVITNHFSKSIVERNYEVPIYRYLTFERLIEIITQNRITIFKTSSWEDPYENFLYKTRIKGPGYYASFEGFLDLTYGQCWTLRKETDAMWRIYSPNKQTMKIKSRISKLAAISRNEENYQEYSTALRVIDPVEYYSKTRILNLIKEHELNALTSLKNPIKSLFIKREEFRHEQEVRLIIQKNTQIKEDVNKSTDPNFISLIIEPNDFIEEIILDPRLNCNQAKLYSEIFKSLSFHNNIKKSKLYENFQ